LRYWADCGASGAVKAARPCVCGCGFRHRHGWYTRFVVAGRCQWEIRVPRLRCPVCGRTEVVTPWFLPPRSPYPWCVRQAAVLGYLVGRSGHRDVARRLGLDWQLLWLWLDALAREARELLLALIRVALRYPHGQAEPPLAPRPSDVAACRQKALTQRKRENLAALKAVLLEAYRLWVVASRIDSTWPEPDPHGVLDFLATLRRVPA